jgi:hypothetical protein
LERAVRDTDKQRTVRKKSDQVSSDSGAFVFWVVKSKTQDDISLIPLYQYKILNQLITDAPRLL